METCNDTLPLPADVEREFVEHGGDGLNAERWLEDCEIDPAPILGHVGKIALIRYGLIWIPQAGRYDFKIYPPEHTGPKHPEALAVPIIEDGEFLDLLLIGDDFSFETVTCRVPWLGQDNLRQSTVRLVLLCIPCTESIVRHGLLYRFGLQHR